MIYKMSEFGFKTKIDSNGSIRDMPGEVFLKIRNKLDSNPQDCDWRALARAVNGNYTIKPNQIEKWSPAINGQQSAAGCLLHYLTDRGMTVGELIKFLDKIHVDPFKLGLVDHVPVAIAKDIASDVEVIEGESLYLEVEASGHPYPQFQWFICRDGENKFTPLQGRTENVLKIDNMTSVNRGSYSCQIFNCNDPDETKHSQIALVTVVPNPHPQVYSGLRPPDEKTLAKMLANIGPCTTIPVNGDWKTRSTIQNCSLISRQPTSVNVAMNGSFLLTIETLANPPVSFQWVRNEEPLLGQVYQKLHVEHAMPEDFGEYFCIVNDGNRGQRSNTVSVTEKVLKLAKEIVIVSSPKSLEVEYGGDVLFSCEARCPEPLKYQWFKDGQPLPGQDRAELKIINVQDRRCEGAYLCEISLLNSGKESQRCLTSTAQLRVKLPPGPPDNIKYNPSDKVALLIGNSDYRSEDSLNAPPHDVRTLAQIFQKLQFKVVALLNLTQREIQNIVNYFCKLIDKNVYVVFYFCGHGFERHGNTFLVPTDARAGYSLPECVCTEEILESIQEKDPALIFMILDLCRKGNSVPGKPLNKQFVWEKGNIVYCYATSIGQNAFEYKTNGLLVRHMAPLLQKTLGLDALISELKAEFSRYPGHSEKQIPHLSSNLLETGRKLTDLISYKGQTESFQRRDLDWRNSLKTPPKQNVYFSGIDVVVELDFQAEFSNVLNIFSTVVNLGNSSYCEPYIRNWPATVSLMGDIKLYKIGNGNVTKSTSTLQDIQKLQDDLVVGVAIKYVVVIDNQMYRRNEVVKVNLGRPLVSPLKLWKQPEEAPSSGRQATEFDETES